MLHAFSVDGLELGGAAEDIVTSMAISQGCKRVSSELYVQKKCEELMAGKPANEVAVGIAAIGGYAACAEFGPLVAGLCATAAAKVANWLLKEYTPAERAEMLYDAARGGSNKLAAGVYMMGGSRAFAGWPTCIDHVCVQRTLPGIVQANLRLIGAGDTWTKPKEQAVAVILMAIAASGRGGESVYFWVSPRGRADIPSPLRASPFKKPGAGSSAAQTFPIGSIAAFDPAIGRYRIAVPVGLAGAAYREVGTSATRPSGVAEVPLPTYQDQTGTRPWYRNWKVWSAALAVTGVATAGGALALRRRRRH